jgi:hypothetical protein
MHTLIFDSPSCLNEVVDFLPTYKYLVQNQKNNFFEIHIISLSL